MMFRLVSGGLLAAVMSLAVGVPNAHAEGVCHFTQGYWQNRAQNAGDLTTEVWLSIRDQSFYLSGRSYRQVLTVSPRGNAYWILAHQLVAAQANYANGAQTPLLVSEALTRANELMSQYTPAQIAAMPKSSELRKELIALSRVLDDWNNGLIDTGCGGDTGGGGT